MAPQPGWLPPRSARTGRREGEPDDVVWSGGTASSLFSDAACLTADAPPVPLPYPVEALIESVVCHRDSLNGNQLP